MPIPDRLVLRCLTVSFVLCGVLCGLRTEARPIFRMLRNTQDREGAKPAATVPASASAPVAPGAVLAQARRDILEGFYDKAREQLRGIATEPSVALHITLAQAEIEGRIGQYREA